MSLRRIDPELESVTLFKLDPVIASLTVNDLRAVLESALEGCEDDEERVDCVIEMLMP